MSKIIMHIDLDAFFAAVEEREHPEYKGKPVVVGADPREGKGRGVVSTCNYSARKYGIHSAMPISQAYKACPDAVFVRPNMQLYIQTSRKIMAIIRKYGDSFQQVSVDEAFIDATDAVKKYGSSRELAESIKKEVEDKEKLTCSIGIGSNKLIAKIASDFNKPDALTIVKPGKEKEFLAPLPVRKLWGVGVKTEEHLKKKSIETVRQLAAVREEVLVKELGKFGSYIHRAALGYGSTDVSEDYEGAKSMSRNTTFYEDTKDSEKIEAALDKMSESVHNNMIKDDYKCRTIGIRVRFADFDTFTRKKTISPTDDVKKIKEITKKLLQPFYSDKRKIRLVGVRVTNFVEADAKQKTVTEYN